MLTQLQIRDFALIERVQLNFAEGMTTLTGETGAGKSILIDALGLILGDRANASLVRPGADAAEVIASFRLASDNPGWNWLREQALDEDDECIIRRLVSKDGKSKAWINGRPAPAQSLRDLGENLIAIHGQHENQRLLSRRHQRDLLDQYAGLMPLRSEVRQASGTLASLITRREELQASQAARADRLELLGYQLEEIDQLQPERDEFDRLHQEHNLLSHANELVSTSSRLADQLYDADLSLHDQVSRAISELSGLLRHDETLGSIIESLETANVHLEEAAAALRDRAETVEHDPEHLDEIQQRLDALHGLARKHRVAPEQLHEHIASLRNEFESLRGSEADMGELENRIEAAWQLYREAATKLAERRRAAASKLAKKVTDSIRQLGMPHGQFDIAITPRTDESPSEYGLDEVEFVIAPNPGQPPQPLAKIASGGELSRVSLALKTLTASFDPVESFIFDEVDTGIGGATAETVGAHLRSLGDHRQVFCVTHLPQVAAQGHHQCKITKHQEPGHTRTVVNMLSLEERIEELARMFGGIKITEQTRQLAREILHAHSGPHDSHKT